MIHALTLLIVLLAAAPLAKLIPLCVLAAILFVVAFNMGAWDETREILKLSRADIGVWLITFGLTVFADLTVAVEAGMILAALVYIRKVTATTTVSRVTDEYVRAGFAHSLQTNAVPPGVAVYRIHGPFLFGSADKLDVVRDDLADLPPVVMLRLRNMTAIDGTGLHALEKLAALLRSTGRHLVLCGVRDQPSRLMNLADFHRRIGEDNIQPTLEAGVRRARQILAAADGFVIQAPEPRVPGGDLGCSSSGAKKGG
jgi:SulP family sulfate permease